MYMNFDDTGALTNPSCFFSRNAITLSVITHMKHIWWLPSCDVNGSEFILSVTLKNSIK